MNTSKKGIKNDYIRMAIQIISAENQGEDLSIHDIKKRVDELLPTLYRKGGYKMLVGIKTLAKLLGEIPGIKRFKKSSSFPPYYKTAWYTLPIMGITIKR